MTNNMSSIVGPVGQGKEGQFTAVGHNGEGMTRCYGCAVVMADMVLCHLQGSSFSAPAWFPLSYLRNVSSS